MTISYLAGSRVRSTVTFVPEAGHTAIGTTSATATSAEGTVVALTVVADVTDTYHADIAIPTTAISGPWVVHWKSTSPIITVDDHFTVTASNAYSP